MRQPDSSPQDAETARAASEVPALALARARDVARGTGHAFLADLLAEHPDPELQALNNALMDTFREHRDVEAFSLLFELNARPFGLIATRLMRMVRCRADVGDILQDAFLSIYRYPTRFVPNTPNAFRNWAYSIIRNTVYRHVQKQSRDGVPVDILAETLTDPAADTPLGATVDAESGDSCQKTYLLLLLLYMEVYERELKPRDKRALQLVEVQQLGYREAAERLEIRLENFKMVVCRARKKIFQGLVRILGTRQP